MSPRCRPACPGIRGATLLLLLPGLGSCLHQYQFVPDLKTWADAQAYCRARYADLATVDNAAEMQLLVAAVDSGYQGDVWIGAFDRSTQWQWSLADPRYYQANEMDFRKWDVGQPNYTRKEPRLCVGFYQGFWFDYSCDLPLTFVCYNNSDPALPPTSTHNYIHVDQLKSWYPARTYCQKTYTDLVSVRNEAENALVQQVVPLSQRALMGLNRFTWTWWSDYSAPLFANWAPGHPLTNTGDCAAAVVDAAHLGQWVEHPCDSTFSFMCYNTKKRVFVVKLKAPKSSADLNDPDVLNGIMAFMKDAMKDVGFTRHFTLSWRPKPNVNIFRADSGGLR